MPEQSLRVAIIGLGGFGSRTLQALRKCEGVNLVGVADRNQPVSEQVGRELGVPAYPDDRQLLSETQPQAVYIAAPPMAYPDLLTGCADRGIHVWKKLPLARNLDEGVAMVRRMDQAKLKFAVGLPWRFMPTYDAARRLVPKLGGVFLARAHYLFNWGPDLGWHGDKSQAGGGALLQLGYLPIDLLVWLLGMPEDAYGCCARGHRPQLPDDDQARPVYDTDDTAAAVLRFGDGCMATVVTTRSSGPVSEELILHGRAGSLAVNSDRCVLRSPDGAVLEHHQDESGPTEAFRRQAESFAHAVLTHAKTYDCSGSENLLTLAVVETIYLADRTGQPENPLRLLKTRGLEQRDCTRCRPEPEQDAGAAANRPADEPA